MRVLVEFLGLLLSHQEIPDALSAFAPSDQHREDIQQSWFGTLIGQATAAVAMVVAYLAAIGLLYRYVGGDLERLHTTNSMLFYGGVGLPLILVGIFSVGPAILRARREQKLRPLSRNTTTPNPGYFRLHPYEAIDSSCFSRPDGALDDAMAWLGTTSDPVLYLSGASGSGKSSLVDAGLTPALSKKGWKVLFVRGMGTPMSALTMTLQNNEELFSEKPSDQLNLRACLMLASEERDRVNGGPLLIVMDQFEEFLILDQGAEKESYAAFLRDLAANPIDNIRLLHVFRSDYRELIFRERLPECVDRDTSFSLPSFTRKDAQSFLNDGPVQLDAKGYDELFAALDRIEETRGLYRPITLNMIGFVLERQGSMLTTAPAQLIDTYLRDCILHSTSKDFTLNVLAALITREGTKAPREVDKLASATRLKTWQVEATLADLHREGLVRPVAGLWEISHDFLARLIGQITGRLQRPWLARIATPTLAVAGIGWLVAMAIGVPMWVQKQETRALEAIRELGFSQHSDVGDGLHFSASRSKSIDNKTLIMFGKYAERLKPIHELDLRDAKGLTSLAGIENLTALTSLDLKGATGLTSLAGIENLTALTSLDLSYAIGLTSLAGIEKLTALTSLDLKHVSGLTSLARIEGLTALTSLDLMGAHKLTSLAGIEKLTSLEDLNLFFTQSLTSLAEVDCGFLREIDRLRINSELRNTCDD